MTIHLTVKTNQEAYDAVKAHLSTMSKRAALGSTCLYCTDDGRRCAIGALLDCSDDEARGLRPDTIRSLAWDGVDDPVAVAVGVVDVELLSDLQRVHDDTANWIDGFVGHDALERVARKWGLTP